MVSQKTENRPGSGARKVLRIISLLLAAEALLLLLPTVAGAESRLTVDLTAASLAASGAGGIESSWSGLGSLRGALTFDQSGNRNVRSQVRIEASVPSAGIAAAASADSSANTDPLDPPGEFTLPRAYIKFRFPDLFTAMVGKGPITWGEGRYYNSGNLPVAAVAAAANLVSRDFEDAALWQGSFTFPLGPFSFFETLFLPDSESLLLEDSSGGARLVVRPLGIKGEASYLFDGRDVQAADPADPGNPAAQVTWADWTHKLALGLQGNLFLDWHLTGSIHFPNSLSPEEAAGDTLRVSAGLYSLASVGPAGTLNFRLEALFAPFGRWEEVSGGLDATDPYDAYGAEIYPELSYDFGNGFSLMLRSVISPVDASGVIIPGAVWNVFQGFNLISFVSVQFGEADDTYSINKPGGIAAQLACSVTY